MLQRSVTSVQKQFGSPILPVSHEASESGQQSALAWRHSHHACQSFAKVSVFLRG